MLRVSIVSFFTLIVVLMLIVTGCAGSQSSNTNDEQAVLLQQLQNQLDQELNQLALAGEKFTAEPPCDEDSAAVVSWNNNAGELSWCYYSTGDYDQNSETNAGDLVPIATNYLAAGPFDAATVQSCIDGDGNGEINSADLVPIAANFNNIVSGYNVYRSAAEDDYPDSVMADNGSAELLATVAFSSATGTDTERKQFSYTVASPQSGDYYWVRPTDGTTEGIPSNLVSGSTPELTVPVQTMEGYTLPPGSGGLGGPYVVDGKPAMLITNGDDYNGNPLYFLSATDVAGTSWNAPVEISALGKGTPSLVIIDGNPAVAYGEYSTDTYLYYRRANDAAGTTWGAPVAVDTTNAGAGSWCCMLEVDGRPGIAWARDGGGVNEHGVYYLRADDATGSAWSGTPQDLDADNLNNVRMYYPQMVIIDGRPAVAYNYNGKDMGGGVYEDGVRYVIADDAQGTAWQTPAGLYVLDNETGFIATVNLLDMGGIPGVGWFVEDWDTVVNSTVYFRIATDADATGWGDVQVIDTGASSTSSVSGKAPASAGDQIKFVTFTQFSVSETQSAVCCVMTKIFADSRGGADGRILYLVPGQLDWQQYSSQFAMGFDAGAATSSLRPGGNKQVSCGGGCISFFGIVFYFPFYPFGDHSVSAEPDLYFYSLVAEYNLETSAIDVLFASQGLDASMLQ